MDQQSWEELQQGEEVKSYPQHIDLLPHAHRATTIETEFDRQTVVYDCSPPGDKRVLQFTLRSSQNFNVSRLFTNEPIYETGTYCVGACYSDGVLFVLFVEGNRHRYQQMIRKSHPDG